MGYKEMILILLIFFCFSSTASLFPLGRTLSSVHLQESKSDERRDEHSTSLNGGGNDITHRSNLGHSGAGRGGEGGHAGASSTGQGNGGESSQHTPTGAAVIPVYAAGAANGHRKNPHSGGSCNRSCPGLLTLVAFVLASLVVHIYM